jgi:D-glycero-D-manno-heptose 1,7-bisphosphate phosphatase
MNRGGIFLDRDGTINQEVDYLSSPDQLRLIPGSADAIREANTLGLKVIIITNQSGIARGVLTEEQLSEIHHVLIHTLQEQNARIDAIYYCPHHPDFGGPLYQKDCDCRKPNTGMITQAVKDFTIDTKASFVIGDRMIDVQLGNTIGATSILVLTGYGKQELEFCRQYNIHIDHIAQNLFDAMNYVKNVLQQQRHLPSPSSSVSS